MSRYVPPHLRNRPPAKKEENRSAAPQTVADSSDASSERTKQHDAAVASLIDRMSSAALSDEKKTATSAATALVPSFLQDDPSALDHVVEVYDFPAGMKTYNLQQLLAPVMSDVLDLRWIGVDRVVAVFSSPQHARKALAIEHAFFKLRPLSEAPKDLQDSIKKEDIPKAVRPKTDATTANRLISRALQLNQGPRRTRAELDAIRAKEKEERRLRRERQKPKAPAEDNSAWDD